jgi:glycosyltransferase involved in cell wall biosynthesis
VTPAPEVTVAIPTRGRWPLLSVTLASALAQRDVDVEVVVVDDGSRDQTAARLAELSDRRLRVVSNEHPRGVAAARNRALAEARGQWLAFLDDDDLWAPKKLRAQLAAAGATGADFAYAAAVVVDERYVPFHEPPLPDPERLAAELSRANVVPAGSSNVIARTELLHAVGGLDERFGELDDWDLWLRLARAGRAAVCPEVLVAYVEHAGNMPTARHTDLLADLDLLMRKHAAAEPPLRVEPDRLDYARWVARGHGRAGRRLAAARAYAGAAVRHRSPGDAARALRVLAAGQPRRFRRAGAVPDPDWLIAYRQAAAR